MCSSRMAIALASMQVTMSSVDVERALRDAGLA
jgi:hypothetical protein